MKRLHTKPTKEFRSQLKRPSTSSHRYCAPPSNICDSKFDNQQIRGHSLKLSSTSSKDRRSALKCELSESNHPKLKSASEVDGNSPLPTDCITDTTSKNFYEQSAHDSLPILTPKKKNSFEIQSTIPQIEETDKQLNDSFEIKIECSETVSNPTTSALPHYSHKDSCLGLLLSEDTKEAAHDSMANTCGTLPNMTSNPTPVLAPLLSIPAHSAAQNFNYLPPPQTLPQGQDYASLCPPNTSQDHPWMALGLPAPQPSTVTPEWGPHYLCSGAQLPYNSPLPPYPHQYLGSTSGRCWNQNIPAYKHGIHLPNNSFSDNNLMSGPFMKNLPGCYLLHSMVHSPPPFSFVPKQKPFKANTNVQELSLPQSSHNITGLPVVTSSHSITGLPAVTSSHNITGLPVITSTGSNIKNLPLSNKDIPDNYSLNQNPNTHEELFFNILASDVELIDHSKTKDYFPVFPNHQIPKSPDGSPKAEFILAKYIDFLLLENEGITEMSKAFTPLTPLFSEEDEYILEAAAKKTKFPTPKFVEFTQRHFPGVDLQTVNFLVPSIHSDAPEKLHTKEDIMNDSFFHFQLMKNRIKNSSGTY